MSVKKMSKQELVEQSDMWDSFADCAMALAESARRIADNYRPEIGEYIKQCDAARLVGVSRQRICNAVRDGELTAYTAGLKVTEVLEWAKRPKHRHGNTNIYHID